MLKSEFIQVFDKMVPTKYPIEYRLDYKYTGFLNAPGLNMAYATERFCTVKFKKHIKACYRIISCDDNRAR